MIDNEPFSIADNFSSISAVNVGSNNTIGRAVTGTGFAGVKDKHSGHSWQKFKGALSGALLSGALIGVTSKNTDNAGDRSYGQEAMTGAATDLIQNITSTTKNRDEIKSTTTIRIGYQFNILLNADVVIQPWEE